MAKNSVKHCSDMKFIVVKMAKLSITFPWLKMIDYSFRCVILYKCAEMSMLSNLRPAPHWISLFTQGSEQVDSVSRTCLVHFKHFKCQAWQSSTVDGYLWLAAATRHTWHSHLILLTPFQTAILILWTKHGQLLHLWNRCASGIAAASSATCCMSLAA